MRTRRVVYVSAQGAYLFYWRQSVGMRQLPHHDTLLRHVAHGRIDKQSNGATCNDCHVPHQNLALKYGFKAMDGLKHTAYFVMHSERQAPMAETLTGQVVMDNCIRCHEQLNTEFVKTGRMGYMKQQAQGGKACWDCHRNVPHGGMNSLMATPGAEGVTPLPPSPVPGWLQNMMN